MRDVVIPGRGSEAWSASRRRRLIEGTSAACLAADHIAAGLHLEKRRAGGAGRVVELVGQAQNLLGASQSRRDAEESARRRRKAANCAHQG